MSKQVDKRVKGWRRFLSSQRGIETVEWIAVAAVILTLLAGMLTMATPIGRDVATSMFGKISQWVARWGGEGGPIAGGSPPGGQRSPGGVPGGQPSPGGGPGGQPSSGGGPGGSHSPSPATGPSTGIPRLVGGIVNPGGSAPGWDSESGRGVAGISGGRGGGGSRVVGGGESWQISTDKGTGQWNIHQVSYSRTNAYVKDADGNWVRDKNVEDNAKWKKERWKKDVTYGVSFWEAKKTFAQGAVSKGKLGSDNLYVSGELGSHKTVGQAKIGWDNKGGFVASATGQVGVYAAKVTAEATSDHQFAPGYSVGGTAKGEAWVGAEAAGKATLKLGKDGVQAGVGGEAFVGGKAEATGQVRGEIAGVKAAVTGKAAVSYGLGVKAEYEGGYQDGKLSFKTELGATLGLGVNVGVDATVDVGAAAQRVADVGKEAMNLGREAWNSLFGSLPPPIYAQLSPPIRGPTWSGQKDLEPYLLSPRVFRSRTRNVAKAWV